LSATEEVNLALAGVAWTFWMRAVFSAGGEFEGGATLSGIGAGSMDCFGVLVGAGTGADASGGVPIGAVVGVTRTGVSC
jgi:hypothetical protein